MRIHTDKLTASDLTGNLPDGCSIDIMHHGSQSRDHAAINRQHGSSRRQSKAKSEMRVLRERAGLYVIYARNGAGADVIWTVEERRENPAYGDAWLWFATSNHGDVLDPLPTLRDCKRAITTTGDQLMPVTPTVTPMPYVHLRHRP